MASILAVGGNQRGRGKEQKTNTIQNSSMNSAETIASSPRKRYHEAKKHLTLLQDQWLADTEREREKQIMQKVEKINENINNH